MEQKKALLVVDDSLIDRSVIKDMLSDMYPIIEADDGRQALRILKDTPDQISGVLLDLVMPEIDGFSFLEEIKSLGLLQFIPVFLVTNEGSFENEKRAYELGVADFIRKPLDKDVLQYRVFGCIHKQEMLQSLVYINGLLSTQLEETTESVVDVFTGFLEQRSWSDVLHIRRFRSYMLKLLSAVSVKYNDNALYDGRVRLMADACIWYDIGKTVAPGKTYYKKGKKLSVSELQFIKSQTSETERIVRLFSPVRRKEYIDYAIEIAKYYMERYDGKGYPSGIKGKKIPICAQVAGLVDSYETLTAGLVENAKYSHEKVVEMILSGECGAFNKNILEAFEEVAPEFTEILHKFDPSKAEEDINNDSVLWDDFSGETYRIDYPSYTMEVAVPETILYEFDSVSGKYWLVYPKLVRFRGIKPEGDFLQTTKQFVEKFMHPDDRVFLLMRVEHYINSLKNNAPLSGGSIYRVYSEVSGKYKKFKISFIPHGLKAFIILQPEEDN